MTCSTCSDLTLILRRRLQQHGRSAEGMLTTWKDTETEAMVLALEGMLPSDKVMFTK